MPDTQEDDTDNASLAMITPPKKPRRKTKKSLEGESNAAQFVTDSLLLTPMAEKVDSTVAGGNATRTRGRGRRQEITPMRLGVDPDSVDSLDSSIFPGGVPIGLEPNPDGAIKKCLLTPVGHHQTYQPRLRQSKSPLLRPLPEHSIVGQQDEEIRRLMSQSQDASPIAGHEEHEEQKDVDPTNEHYDYDTILESEGFSMVSVESLGSAGNQCNESAKHQSILSDRNDTPAIDSSPSEPPAPQNANPQPLSRHMEEPREGTPKLARVVRAGVALQGVLSPGDRSQRLGSPFGKSREATSPALSSPVSKKASPKQRLDNLFSGFGAGTRRELRAGLRLGEELAKKQQKLAQETESNSGVDEDVFRAVTNVQYPRLPESNAETGYNLTVPDSRQGPGEDVCYPRLSRNQLPTPARSEADADEGRMSWKADTPPKSENTAERTAFAFGNDIEGGPDESTIDHTMMEREAEWQREREAISRQIELANKSQVIVIDSDEEADEQPEDQGQALDRHDEEEDSDIWQAEAHTGHYSRELTPEASDTLLQPEIIKPRRSKLPSPWRRNGHIIYTYEPELTEADSSQQTDHTQAKDSLRLNESPERELDDTEYSSQPDDSTGALITRQLSPVKDSNIKSDKVYQESLDETDDSGQPGDSTSALIARHLSPRRDYRTTVTAAKASSPFDSVKRLLEGSSEQQAEADSVPATPENKREAESSEVLEGDTTTTSIDIQSHDGSPCWSIKKPLGKTIADDTVPIDPFLLQSGKQSQKLRSNGEHAPRPPMTVQSTSPAQTTWISRLTAPIWSVLTPGPALPPPATKSDILCSSPYEPLCQLTPWEPCHMRALGPLYLSSLLYGAHIFPFNPKSAAAAYYGVSVTTSLGWSRTVTKRDCSVSDAFMVLLDERGYALGEPGEQWIEEGLAIRMCVSIWVGMVMRGEIAVNASNGEKAGLRKQGDRLWTSEDISWKSNASEYFERKRREFDGLPSWKAMGIRWPPL